jgi:hypothetical protein
LDESLRTNFAATPPTVARDHASKLRAYCFSRGQVSNGWERESADEEQTSSAYFLRSNDRGVSPVVKRAHRERLPIVR